MLESLSSLDQSLFDAMQVWRSPWVADLAKLLSRQAVAGSVAAAALAALIYMRRGERIWSTAILLVMALLLGDLLGESMKTAVNRDRPYIGVEGAAPLGGRSENSPSFPSNHAVNSTALATVIACQYARPVVIPLVALLIAGAVGVSRVLLGVHYPFDVAAGMLLGASIGLLCAGVWRWRPLVRNESGGGPRTLDARTLTVFALLILTAFRIRFLFDQEVCLSADEAQYWDWSRNLDWAYYSKPPLIAWMIWATTGLFGSTEFGVRIGAVICSVLMSVVTWKFTREVAQSEGVAASAVLTLNVVPMFAAGSVLMTTDGPQMLFWALASWMYYRAMVQGDGRAWWWAGLFLGMGALAKYAIVFLVPCVLLFAAFTPAMRHHLRRGALWGSFGLGVLVFSPVIVWNMRMGWVSALHVARQTTGHEAAWQILPLSMVEFIGSQAGVLGPVVFGILVAAWVVWWRTPALRSDHALRFLMFTSTPVLAGFVVRSLFSKVQANWAAAGYFTALVFAAVIARHVYVHAATDGRRRAYKALAAAALVTSGAIAFFAHDTNVFSDWGIRPNPKRDPTTRLYGWDQLGRRVFLIRERMPFPERTFLFSQKYQVTTELAFYVPDQPRTYCVNFGRRMNQYDLWPGVEQYPGWDALFVTTGHPEKADYRVKRSFEHVMPPQHLVVLRKGVPIEKFSVVRCFGFKGRMDEEGAGTKF